MDKILGRLVVFAIVAGVIIGAGAVWATGQTANEVTAARARAEAARASQLEADAARAWVQAEADRQALADITIGKRWAALLSGVGFGVGVFVLAVGLAFAVTTWANVRARVIRDAAGAPVIVDRRWDGTMLVLDTGRALQTLTTIAPDGTPSMSFAGNESSALQLASQSQAAGALVGMAQASNRPALADRIPNMPPVRGMLADVQRTAPAFGRDVRLVYVRDPRHRPDADDANAQAEQPAKPSRLLSDIQTILTGADVRGIGRRALVPTLMSRDRYDAALRELARGGFVQRASDGWTLTADKAAALAAFGLDAGGGDV